MTHLRGLKSIINLRGDTGNLHLDGVHMMLESLDLLHAVLYDNEPILANASASEVAERSDSIKSKPTWFTSLLLAEQDEFQKAGRTPYTDNLVGLTSIIEGVGNILRNEFLPTRDPSLVEKVRNDLEDFGRRATRDHPSAPDARHLGRCCFQYMCILFNLTANKVPHRHKSNQLNVEQLYDAVRRVKNSTWQQIPYHRLLVLLTAAIATSDQSTKSFFKAELVRSIYQMGLTEWRRIEAFILRFLEVSRVLERSDRVSSPPLEMASFQSPTETFNPALFSRQAFSASLLQGKMPALPRHMEEYTASSHSSPPSSQQSTPFDEGDIDPMLMY